MNTVLRLALVGASIVALAAPALARSHKGDRMTRHTAAEQTPIAMRRQAPAQVLSGTDWDTQRGYDRASSPFGHGGY